MKASDLFTRAIANAGTMIDIPDRNGLPTGDQLRVHHVDSDAYRAKRSEVYAAIASMGKDVSEKERKAALDAGMLELLASTVSGWTLEDEFSPAACIELLENAPYLCDWLDKQASDNALFFGKGSTG